MKGDILIILSMCREGLPYPLIIFDSNPLLRGTHILLTSAALFSFEYETHPAQGLLRSSLFACFIIA